MQCPVCKTVSLHMAERHGVEIDYCPECRGVWLDRGELDKIIERAAAETAPARPQAAAAPQPEARAPGWDTRPHAPPYADPRHTHYPKKKREGFLSELFDFD